MQNSETTLILGLAAGYHYGDVRPFLQSLDISGYRGRCVLFVSPTTRDLQRMAAHGVELRPFVRPQQYEHVPYNAWRYFLYRDYLRQCGRRLGRILLTDVRDVIFQKPPFAFDWPEHLSLFLEDASMLVGDCAHMQRWIHGHLGPDALDKLARERIICSGTTIAGFEAMQHYLERMTARLLPFTPGQRMAGYDQGLHNLLARTGELDKLAFFDNAGPVLTLGYKPQSPPLDRNALVCNDSGEAAHIVHQYDRHMELFKQLRARYV